MRFKAGKYYICKSTHTRFLNIYSDTIQSGTFYKGKVYYSDVDNRITDSRGLRWNQLNLNYDEYFEEYKNYYINSKEIRNLCNI